MNLPLDPDPVRHPRRFGFLIFNAICALVLVAWLIVPIDSLDEGIAALPDLALSTAAIAVLAIVWIGSWIAWGVMVWNRHRRQGNNPRP